MNKLPLVSLGVLIALVMAACSATVRSPVSSPLSPIQDSAAGDSATRPLPAASEAEELPDDKPDGETEVDSIRINRRVTIEEDIQFPALLPFDAIRPVYDPQFGTAGEVPLDDDEMVIGIHLNGESKAYSITVLRSREMVNDKLGGLPILVTW